MYARPSTAGAPTSLRSPEQPLPPGRGMSRGSGRAAPAPRVDAGAAAGPDPTWGSVKPGRYGWGGPAAKERRLDLTAGLPIGGRLRTGPRRSVMAPRLRGAGPP